MSSSAPSWTDAISDNILCGYFYFFFVLFAIWAALSVIGGIVLFASSKMNAGQLMFALFNILLSGGIAGTQALFLYLICDRSLKPSQHNEQPRRMV